MNARPDNRGIYLCIAENDGGNDQTSTFIDIERKFFQKEKLIKYRLSQQKK